MSTTKLYFKYNKDIDTINDTNVIDMINKNTMIGRNDVRIRVIIKDNNYNCPLVQLAEYEFEKIEPWKSDYWMVDETTWNGEFIPDNTWKLIEL